MDVAAAAALTATLSFAGGDTLVALAARRIGGQASMLLTTPLRLLIYSPFCLLWFREFKYLDVTTLAWIVPLGTIFALANICFNVALEVGTAAIVGVVAGAFPAVATVIAIVFLGERPTGITILLLCMVLVGIVLLGLPKNYRKALRLDKGTALAIIALLCWGVFFGLLKKPIGYLGSQHAWFVVQFTVTIVVVLLMAAYFNRRAPKVVANARHKQAGIFVLVAALTIGLGEGTQALALGRGETAAIAAILGGYPAVYALIANRIFREPLIRRQWLGIGVVAVAIVLLSAGV